MTRALRTAAPLAAVLLLAGCGDQGGSAAAPTTTTAASTATAPSVPTDGLVLQIGYTGGFTTAEVALGRLPMVSVYADGRAIAEGPVPMIYPGPALPNVQVAQLDPADLESLVQAALDAGVAETGDLGEPPIADAPSVRFTLVTSGATSVREVYALGETSGLTPAQIAAREDLIDLQSRAGELAQGGDVQQYAPTALAVLSTPWIDAGDGFVQPDVSWPGPALPGAPTGGLAGVGCVDVTGDQVSGVPRRRAPGEPAHALGRHGRHPVVAHLPAAAARGEQLRRPHRLSGLTQPGSWPAAQRCMLLGGEAADRRAERSEQLGGREPEGYAGAGDDLMRTRLPTFSRLLVRRRLGAKVCRQPCMPLPSINTYGPKVAWTAVV